jgi:hypothetical protein
VHHQSNDYNLAVALRQAVLAGFTSWVFYLPLAFVLPPEIFVTSKAINLIYQFWIHTRAIGRLGPLEWFMNTPSHHRVHHGMNAKYVDRNYAGIFIIWDRLLGTFQVEEEEPVYGTLRPYRSWNPVWAQLDGWAHLWSVSKQARGFDKLRVWFMPPEWTPAGVEPHRFPTDEELRAWPRYNADARGYHLYVGLQFVPVVAGVAGLLLTAKDGPLWLVLAIAAWLLFSLVTFSSMFERRPWALRLELVRLGAGAAIGGVLASGAGTPAIVAIIVAAVGSAAWVLHCDPGPGAVEPVPA